MECVDQTGVELGLGKDAGGLRVLYHIAHLGQTRGTGGGPIAKRDRSTCLYVKAGFEIVIGVVEDDKLLPPKRRQLGLNISLKIYQLRLGLRRVICVKSRVFRVLRGQACSNGIQPDDCVLRIQPDMRVQSAGCMIVPFVSVCLFMCVMVVVVMICVVIVIFVVVMAFVVGMVVPFMIPVIFVVFMRAVIVSLVILVVAMPLMS